MGDGQRLIEQQFAAISAHIGSRDRLLVAQRALNCRIPLVRYRQPQVGVDGRHENPESDAFSSSGLGNGIG